MLACVALRCSKLRPVSPNQPQFGGARLSSLAFSQPEAQQAACVRLEGLDDATPLAPVLAALLPPSAGLALQRLELKGRPQPDALLGCGQLLGNLQVNRGRLRPKVTPIGVD